MSANFAPILKKITLLLLLVSSHFLIWITKSQRNILPDPFDDNLKGNNDDDDDPH